MSKHPADITVNVSMQLDQSVTVVFADINKRVAEQQRKMTAAYTKGFADLAKQQKRSADAAIKLNKSVADFKIAADKRAANEAAKAIAKERKSQRDAVKNSVQEHLQAVAQKAAANQAVVDGVLQASEAVVKLGRGFAALGVASEEDVQKITEALDQVQAVMDVAKGSIDTYRGIAGAVKAYQASVTAAATAEKALAAARGASAAAGGATGVTGAAGAAGGAGAASAAAPIVAAVAAIASVGVAAKIVHESLTGSAKNIDSWSMKIGTWQAETTEWMGIWSSGSEKVKAALDKLDGERAGNVRREEVGRIQTSGRFAREDIARESLGNRVTSRDDPAGKDQALTNQAFLVEKQRGSARVSARFGKTESERGLGKNAALKLSNELIGIEKQRLGIAKQVRSEKVAAAKAGVQGAQKELELSKQRLDQLKGSLQSAKERFGQLTPEQQDELKAIMAKAQRNEDLTIEESGKLRSVGTEQARTFAEKSDLGRAKMGKFDESFGSSERGDIANEEGRQKTLAINVQTKKDIQIKVQRENDAFVTGLADFINQEIEKLDRELEAKVQKIVEEKMEVLAKTPNEQLENRYRSGGQPSV